MSFYITLETKLRFLAGRVDMSPQSRIDAWESLELELECSYKGSLVALQRKCEEKNLFPHIFLITRAVTPQTATGQSKSGHRGNSALP